MLKEKLLIFLITTLLLHIPLLALTHRQNDRWRNKYTRCAWAGGTFFQLCHCVSFFFVAGNSFRCYLPTIPVVPLCLVAQVSFLVVAGKSFRCYLLTNHTSCSVVSVFWFWREIVFGCTVFKKASYLVSLRERGSVYLSLYLLTVTIISQKYRELSLQVEISE
jgi:hypothetical protein